MTRLSSIENERAQTFPQNISRQWGERSERCPLTLKNFSYRDYLLTKIENLELSEG